MWTHDLRRYENAALPQSVIAVFLLFSSKSFHIKYLEALYIEWYE